MGAHATVQCPRCGAGIALQMFGLGQSTSGREAIVQLHTAAFVQHVSQCQGQQHQIESGQNQIDKTEAPLGTEREVSWFFAPGDRACSGCASTNVECLQKLRDSQAACCGMCADGNTHPRPGEDREHA